MRHTVAKELRRIARIIEPSGPRAKQVYKDLKQQWNKQPWNKRQQHMRMLQDIAKKIKEVRKNQWTEIDKELK